MTAKITFLPSAAVRSAQKVLIVAPSWANIQTAMAELEKEWHCVHLLDPLKAADGNWITWGRVANAVVKVQ